MVHPFYSRLAFKDEFVLVLLNSITAQGLCTCGSNICESKGKHPKGKWKNKDFIKDLSVSESNLDFYLKLLNDRFLNLGIKTGLNRTGTKRLIILDFDEIKTEEKFITKLKKENSCEIETGKGIHFYFYLPPEMELKAKIKPQSRGFDILSDGRYAVSAGSVHKSGGFYQWNEKEVKEMPKWLYSYLVSLDVETEKLLKTTQQNVPQISKVKTFSFIPKGKRNSILFSSLLSYVKNNKFVGYSEIKNQALQIRENMEDKTSFSNIELEKVVSSVFGYKKTNNILVGKTFSLEKASELWTRKLTNLGFIENSQDEFLKHIKFFNNLENFILKHGIVKKELTETYTGKSVSEFIDYRNSVMEELFFEVPLWNYVNIQYQNWASVFNNLNFDKKKYRGCKYFGKGNSKQEKVGFGIDFLPKKEVVNLLCLKFGRFLFKFLNKTLNRKNIVKKIHKETDEKILTFFSFNSRQNLLRVNNAIEIFKKMSLTPQIRVYMLRRPKMETEKSETPSKTKETLVKQIKVKNKINKKHLSKYNSMGNIFYTQNDMEYVFDISSDPNGLLRDKEKMEEIISSWKKGDVLGIGINVYVYDSYDKESQKVRCFKSFILKDCEPLEISSPIDIPLSLINKNFDLEHLEVLYRDGTIFSDNENEKYVTYEIYDNQNDQDNETEKKEITK